MTGIGRKWALLVHTPYGAGHGCNGFSDGKTSIRNGKQHLLRHRKRRERHDAEKEKIGIYWKTLEGDPIVSASVGFGAGIEINPFGQMVDLECGLLSDVRILGISVV